MNVDAYGTTNATFYNAMGKVDYSVSQFGTTNSYTNSYTYDARGNVIQIISPFGTTRTVYDDNARPILAADFNGISGTVTQYDPVGRVTSTVRATNVVVNIIADPINPGQWMSVIGSSGVPYSTTSTEYYDNGWVKSRTGPDGQKTSYQYTAAGQTMSVTDPLNHSTYSFYDDAGRQTLMWDALNHSTRFVYDALGRQITTIFDDNSSVTNEYNLVGQRVGQVDQTGRRAQFAYNLAGALTNVIKPQVVNAANSQMVAPQWNYQYDSQGHLLVTTDANGHSTTNAFDEFGRPARRWLSLGQVSSNLYDGQGRLWKLYDFKGQRTEYRYDKFNRVQAKFLFMANATAPSNSVAYNYNQLGQLTNIVERYGTDAGTGYAFLDGGQSGMGAKFMATVGRNPNAFGGMTAFALMAVAIALIPARKRRQFTEFARDIYHDHLDTFWALFGNHWPVGTPRRAASNRRLKMPRLGWRWVTPVVLAALIANEPGVEQLWTAHAGYSYPSNASTATTRYTYFSYDFDGHLVQVNCPEGVINYGYDLATGRHIETNTQNSDVQYGYDELGRLKTVTVIIRNGAMLDTPEVTTYTYDAVGNRSAVSLPNGVLTTYSYDNLNRLTNLVHQSGAVMSASYSYKLDATGRRTNAVEVLRQESSVYLTNTLSWAYDAMYRLTNEVSVSTSPDGTYAYVNAYQYDSVGNRLHRIRTGSGAETVDYVYDNNDALTNETSSVSGLTTYLYDANGSLTNKVASGTTTAYTYNVANKLDSVLQNGTLQASYLYNEQGIRVSQIAGGNTTKYLIDANNHTGYAQVLEEANAAGTLTRSYVIGDDLLAQCGAGAATPNYFLYDGHGSTQQLAPIDGTVNQHYSYDAFGAVQTGVAPLNLSSTTAETAQTTMLYCGEQFDAGLHMYNLRARYYNPSNGRFNQRDTYDGINDDPQSLHKYLYAADNPVSIVDPSGHDGLLIETSFASSLAGGIRGTWEGVRLPTYTKLITMTLLLALLVQLADVVPQAIEKIKEKERNDRKTPYYRYDPIPGRTYFGVGTWVTDRSDLNWSQAVSIGFGKSMANRMLTTMYMYTLMAKSGDVYRDGAVNGFNQYTLDNPISGSDVILTRIITKPDDGYNGPF
jgi:RHS repeat-associated protein